jgi:hypothetical protein
VPKRGDTGTQLTWFWETDHFKPLLGNLIISRIFGQGPPGFGDQLTLATIRDRLAELHKQQRQYEETNPAGVERVSRLIAERVARVCHEEPSLCSRVVADAEQRIEIVPSNRDQ